MIDLALWMIAGAIIVLLLCGCFFTRSPHAGPDEDRGLFPKP